MRPLLALALVSGCLYADPINQRPSLDIQRMESGEIFRKDTIHLKAIASDPENQLVYFKWRAYFCDGQPIIDITAPRPGCDGTPFYTGLTEKAELYIEAQRREAAAPVEQVLVLLEGQDEYGATAKPVQQLVLPVSDRAPDLVLRKDSRYGYVVNTPLNIYAKLGDADDGPDLVQPLDWKVFTPINQPGYGWVDVTPPVPQDPTDPAHVQLGKTFTPGGVGDWEIQAIATDPLGAQTTESVTVTVVPDHAPCISQVAPIAAPAGSTLPMTDPTLFQVNVVLDDLDPWPGVPSDLVLKSTTFQWSILPPGASTRQPLTVTSNQVALDPASYSPGDIVELRVEIADRNNTPITCADANPTCSVISDNNCIQRLTWRVEVR